MIIAIDGPAGSGKSTVSRAIARKLNILYLDTGAMYRAVTLRALMLKADLTDEAALGRIAADARIRLEEGRENDAVTVYLDGEDVTAAIRDPELTAKVKYIAAAPSVRGVMVKEQRSMAGSRDVIAEGRDIGTVVFPNADFKFFLDADLDERAGRRLKELAQMDKKISFPGLKEEMQKRDIADRTRAVSPLKKAEDAILIDTTRLTVEGVIEKVLSLISAEQK